ncbi:MAG: Rrf2 family transcriptional regulator [Elusimicrobiota bacterium]
MKLLTRDTDYAIRALCFIAKRKGGVVNAAELVAGLKIPRPFMRKILQELNKEGILKSYKGKGGGFELNADPSKITVSDLIDVFQGSVNFRECMFKKKRCPNIYICPLRSKLGEIEEYALAKFKGITIKSLTGE